MKPAPKVTRAVHPNEGTRMRYQRALLALVDEMTASVEYWLMAQRRAQPPELAEDALPSAVMRKAFQKLSKRWQKRFEDVAPKVAESFLKNSFQGTDAAFRQALRDAGWAIEFTMTPAMRDAFEASLAENVGLIKSIPAEYLTQVEGIVMRNYAAGQNRKQMAQEIRERYRVSSNRAVLIARDQTRKANAVVQRARQKELGITEAIWIHSHAGKEPRPTHLAMNHKRYSVEKGMWDSQAKRRRGGGYEGAFIFPGELINCFPEDSEVQFADFVSKAYRRFYRGELAEIVTESGKMIRATPNHPILTPNGWIAIGSLDEGDDVLCVPNDRFRAQGLHTSSSPIGKENIDSAVPTFAQVFNSLLNEGHTSCSKVSNAAWFHGDGSSDGNIDVVFAARPLSFGRKSTIFQHLKQLLLSVTNYSTAAFCLFFEKPWAVFNAAHRIMRSFCESLSPFYSLVSHSDAVCITASPNSSSSPYDSTNNRFPVDSVLSRQGEHARAILMFRPKSERIVRVNRLPYEGYVCNLETRHGFYLTGNIIAHNCRCVQRSVLPFTPAQKN